MPRVRRTAPAFVCLVLLLTGCGTSTIRAGATEQTVGDFVFRKTRFRPTDVKCPSGVPAKVGSTLDCRFTGPDGPYVAHVRITSVHGERAVDYIVTRRTG
jgi:hypothetical protein